ncbi:symmetrical bis(5'-nucleosyl)-tetraphosphatase [Bowmanella denitrificans]|uniref:bis(5'-nucleosyl)-tetraphosphatase (symmetrical) n=1 Tax=Bowmanella denitrificans TaxID=366582 RepID=A0ABP3H4U4_9ALTE
MATFIVGDVQACLSPLKQLLQLAGFTPEHDQLWAVGDLIGRGPDALATLQFLDGLGASFNTVLGNHDLHFLAVYAGIKKPKPADKFDQLLDSPDCAKYADWLRHRPMATLLNEQCMLSHAGLYPGWSISDALYWGNQVASELQSDNWKTLLDSMYGSEPQAWYDCQSRSQKLVFTINALTRMRFVSDKGYLDFQSKTGLDQSPPGTFPWFSHPQLKLHPHAKVLFGHWAAIEGKTGHSQCLALDTGYIWGGQLSLYELQCGKFYRVGHQ